MVVKSNSQYELNSPLIGIGWVKCGGALERAILYKALADRIGLPCALHRASSAYAWCEVAVPEMAPVSLISPIFQRVLNYRVGILCLRDGQATLS